MFGGSRDTSVFAPRFALSATRAISPGNFHRQPNDITPSESSQLAKPPLASITAMTTTITAADRAAAWNIRFLRPPPSDRAFAGCYQPLPAHQRFLTWARLHDDLRLCFDLNYPPQEPALQDVAPSNTRSRFLALWFRQPPSSGTSADDKAGQRPCCIYLEDPIGHTASGSFLATVNAPIDVEELGACEDDASTPTLDLTLVLHDAMCSLASWDLESHLAQGIYPEEVCCGTEG